MGDLKPSSAFPHCSLFLTELFFFFKSSTASCGAECKWWRVFFLRPCYSLPQHHKHLSCRQMHLRHFTGKNSRLNPKLQLAEKTNSSQSAQSENRKYLRDKKQYRVALKLPPVQIIVFFPHINFLAIKCSEVVR